MADENGKALVNTTVNARERFDSLWRTFYAISGCQWAINIIASQNLDAEERDKIGGLEEAIRFLAEYGEKIAADAREQAP